MIVFAYPWLFLLVFAPLAVRWLAPPHRQNRLAVRAPVVERLVVLSGSQQQTIGIGRTKAQAAVLAMVWLLVVTALTRPQWVAEPIVHELPMRDLAIAVDLSASMEIEDFVGTDGDRVSRLTALKAVLHPFIDAREGDRIALLVFGSRAFVQVPFTSDRAAVKSLLDELHVRMAGPRTALGDAIGLGIKLFANSELDERVLIVVTDGNDTVSLVPPERAAEIAAAHGIVLHTVGVGDPLAAGEEPLDEALLRRAAAVTGGSYFLAKDAVALAALNDWLTTVTPVQVEHATMRPKRELFHLLLAAAFLLSMLQQSLSLVVGLRTVNAA